MDAAGGGGSAGAGAGGGSFVLVGGLNSIPSCPNGYIAAMQGYWQCANYMGNTGRNSGADCFCGQIKGYNFNNGVESNSAEFGNTTSNYRCTVCASTLGGTPLSSGSTVLWVTKNKYDGNLGGRTGADAKCAADIPSALVANCQNIHAFLSVDDSDEIRDMPNCDIDLDGHIHNWYNCQKPVFWYSRQWNKYTQMANDWQDLLDGTIRISAGSAGVYVPGGDYWTGSNSIGRNIDSNCIGWGNADAWNNGTYGTGDQTNQNWLYSNNQDCRGHYPLLCACQSK